MSTTSVNPMCTLCGAEIDEPSTLWMNNNPYHLSCLKKRKIDPSYMEQDGCQSCKHNFKYSEYDEGSTYYCTHGAPPRPPCGSVWLSERFSGGVSEGLEKWQKWKAGREVKPWGRCKYWEKGDEEDEDEQA